MFFPTSTMIYQSSISIKNCQIVTIFCVHHSVFSPQRRYEYMWNGLYMNTILVLKFHNSCWKYINIGMVFLLHFIPNRIYFIHNLFMQIKNDIKQKKKFQLYIGYRTSNMTLIISIMITISPTSSSMQA
jgi:hypothetical protein